MAGTDATLLSLSGAGYTDSRSFGFASCPWVVGAAEGMNVLLERKLQRPDGRVEHAYNVTNVEYTEFEKQGICDVPAAPGSQYSCFPANTNVLYVGLKVLNHAACCTLLDLIRAVMMQISDAPVNVLTNMEIVSPEAPLLLQCWLLCAASCSSQSCQQDYMLASVILRLCIPLGLIIMRSTACHRAS